MQKRDLYNHEKIFQIWKEQITPKYLEADLTKENSNIFVSYITDLEQGANVSKQAKKGQRSLAHLNRLRSKIKAIMIGLQKKGIKNISDITEKQLLDFFTDWNKTHSIDYAKRFRAFWGWWLTKNRREGKVVLDVTQDLSTSEKKSESMFVWLTKEEFDKFRKYFDEDKQVILSFCFDSIIRSPTELLSLRVEDIFKKNEEVWVNIPNNISKTFGRKFNLVYAGELILKYIEKNKLKPTDYLFNISAPILNDEMQSIAKQIWKESKNEGGEFYKNITLYDLRHSGAIHFRQLFQKTGQSLDLLRERGGWTDFKMINYYTKRLGLDGHIQKEKLLLEEDKTKLEKNLEKQNKEIKFLKLELSTIHGDIKKQIDEELNKTFNEEFAKVFKSIDDDKLNFLLKHSKHGKLQ